ncbi:uncharacterized protein QC761_0024640 [Podospora bellae-mahoneyi]|uniref:Nephrocystin 3-like N-terminal domain-containing protein n=1 Tax=Podospora bellae-mahoneyi TaxID=2093777 RepID=A0ABR0FVX2_9PEZI|nr:hypothetical protein QC761_0024640 [Podospora bellae-mahoneyi]
MSGMQAFSLACGVMQVITFAELTFATCRKILKTGTPDPTLNDRVQDLKGFCEIVEKRCTPLIPMKLNANETKLLAIATRSVGAAQELEAEIAKICPSSSRGKLSTSLLETMKVLIHRRKIEKLEKTMMDGTQGKALEIQASRGFSGLESTLQHFINARSQGHTQLTELFNNEFGNLNTKIASESTHTRQHVSQLSTRLQEESALLAKRDDLQRLLASLKYPSMNERRNNVTDSYITTFEWVFRTSANAETSDDSSSEGSGLDDVGSDGTSQYGSDIESVHEDSSDEEEVSVGLVEWLTSVNEPLFWISGKPGSGKSTLMKFLLHDHRTRRHLELAYPGALMISHFFWLAGQEMERSIRGLLCSLLYQLVSERVEVYIDIVRQLGSSKAKSKEVYTDWSTKELRETLLHVLASSCVPALIFLDGLDQVDPSDGSFALLQLVNDICTLPNMKVCASSRPEVIFNRQLSIRPSFRVQDLTRRDIKSFAKEQRRSCTAAKFERSDSFRDLIGEIAYRADGVFLWAALTVKSLQRGLVHEDSPDELQRRLDALPDGLNALYQDKWNRHNEDNQVYREEAARYLNLLLNHDEYGVAFGGCFGPDGGATAIFLANNAAFRSAMINDQSNVAMAGDQFIKSRSKFGREIVARSAGLVEVSESKPNV